ncbi:MAG: GNAT family N-acetyltransferase [Bacteroidia bacterium]
MRIEIVPFNSVLYKHSLMIRDHVLRKPLGMEITKGDVFDEDQHIHFVAIHEERVVGCVVLIPNYKEGVGKLRQMATLEEVRDMGFGKMLVWQLEKHAKRKGMNQIVLHARHYAAEFYKKLHYIADPEVFQEVGIDHYKMTKSI